MSEASAVNWLELGAGYALDKIVGIKVMGFVFNWYGDHKGSPNEGRAFGGPRNSTYRDYFPQFSTDPNTAADVLAWLREKCGRDIGMWNEALIAARGLVDQSKPHHGFSAWYALEADLPLVWCRMALHIAEGKT